MPRYDDGAQCSSPTWSTTPKARTIGIYRREGGRWVLARDANLVV